MSDELRTYGETFTVEIEGLDQLQADLDSLADGIRLRTAVDMLTEAGEAIAEWMRESIDLTFWRHSNGTLRNSVTSTVERTDAGAEVSIRPDTIYAAIHEFGSQEYLGHPIRPVTARALSWIAQDTFTDRRGVTHQEGERVFFRSVTIPPRPYIANAIIGHEDDVLEIMQEVLYAAIANDAGTI